MPKFRAQLDPVEASVFDWCKRSKMKGREHLGRFLAAHGLRGTFIEVGVHRAEFARQIVFNWGGERYIGIDPWYNPPEYEAHLKDENGGEMNCRFLDREADHAAAYKALRGAPLDWELIKALSLDAAKNVPDRSADCVYLDADHSYEQVCQDLRAWYPKVKGGGFLAGHDLINGNISLGVRRAVYEIVYLEFGLDVYALAGDAWTWYARRGAKWN